MEHSLSTMSSQQTTQHLFRALLKRKGPSKAMLMSGELTWQWKMDQLNMYFL